MTNKNGADETLSSFTYTYAADGNILTEVANTGTTETTTYTYDMLGRLICENGKHYEYDVAGNRTQAIVDTDTTVCYTYNNDGELISETSNNGSVSETTTYTYDANGNLTKKTKGASVTNYAYDVWGNMVSAGNATYTYRADGIRISKTHQYLNNQFTVVGGNVWKDFFGTYTRGIELISNGRQIYLYNIRGDVIQLLEFDGSIYTTYDYDAYGNEYERDNNDGNYFRYCGEYYDTETGFIYLRARYYDPATGRFVAMDTHWNPSNAIYGDTPVKTSSADDCTSLYPNINAIKQSSNQYVYCVNNPIAYKDTNGKWIHLAIGALAGGLLSGISNAIYQKITYGEINGWSVAINSVGGAIGGALTAAGFGSISAGIVSGITDFVDQAYKNDWDFSKVDVVSVVVNAGLGALGAKLGGKAGNTGHLNSMGKNLMKQVKQAVKNIKNPFVKLINAFAAFFDNLSYYVSQTSAEMSRELISIIKSFIPSSIDKVRSIIADKFASFIDAFGG